MKANEFIKKYGLDEAKVFVRSVIDHLSMGDDFNVQELKRLIDSHELVDKCGGLIPCKKILVTRIRHKPNAEYFMVHLEKPNFIQLYRRNEAKLIPNYRFRDLEQAISDVESIK
ncbi:MAG: hypothetical protein [Caudoviricetes sp.]|nr:MAG: hypothetical protein [Caudoviricetes sp.]